VYLEAWPRAGSGRSSSFDEALGPSECQVLVPERAAVAAAARARKNAPAPLARTRVRRVGGARQATVPIRGGPPGALAAGRVSAAIHALGVTGAVPVAYRDVRVRNGRVLPLGERRGRFRVTLSDPAWAHCSAMKR
jgi:hypothetical protein